MLCQKKILEKSNKNTWPYESRDPTSPPRFLTRWYFYGRSSVYASPLGDAIWPDPYSIILGFWLRNRLLVNGKYICRRSKTEKNERAIVVSSDSLLRDSGFEFRIALTNDTAFISWTACFGLCITHTYQAQPMSFGTWAKIVFS